MNYARMSKPLMWIAPVSLLLALFSSSYTEVSQQEFFASLKNFVVIGKPSVYHEVDGIRLKFHYGEMRYNPVGIAQQVLRYSEEQLIKASGLKITPYSTIYSSNEKVVQIAEFFINHYKVEEIASLDVLRLPYEFDYPTYGLNAPWYSGMAQGHAMIVLLHAYKVTNEPKFLSYAEKLFNVLKIPLTDGGVLVTTHSNSIIFEEYADPTQEMSEAPRVLNGNIFAIDGLFWFWYLTGSEDAKRLLTNSIASMNDILPEYNAIFWSYYDLQGNYANAKYHKLHLRQVIRLKEYAELLEIDGLTNFVRVHDRWSLNNALPFFGYFERMLLNKNRMLYVIFLSNFFILLVALFFIKLLPNFKAKKNE